MTRSGINQVQIGLLPFKKENFNSPCTGANGKKKSRLSFLL